MTEIIRIGAIELRFIQDKHMTAGGLDVFEMILQPGGKMPVPHYHESWDETVYGLEGTSSWQVGGHDIELQPGQSLFIKRGVVHGFDNRSGAPAKALGILTPGVLGPEYFREVAVLAAGGPPDPARMKEVMLRHGLVPAR